MAAPSLSQVGLNVSSTTKWVKCDSIEILWGSDTSGYEHTPVAGYTNASYPNLVITREPHAPSRYTVTHSPSGLGLFRYLKRADAQSAIVHLYSLEPDWLAPDVHGATSRWYLAWLTVANTGHYGWNTEGTAIKQGRQKDQEVPVELSPEVTSG
jgi:hypothetical protein